MKNLTANIIPSRLLGVDGNRIEVTPNLTSFIGGTANRLVVSDNGAGGVTLDLHSSYKPNYASSADFATSVWWSGVMTPPTTLDGFGITGGTISGNATVNGTMASRIYNVLSSNSGYTAQWTNTSNVLSLELQTTARFTLDNIGNGMFAGALTVNGNVLNLKGDSMTSPNTGYTHLRIGATEIIARGAGAGNDIILLSNAYLGSSGWVNTQTGTSAYLSISAGAFSFGTAASAIAGAVPAFTAKMTLSNTGDLSVTGNLSAANTKSLTAFGAKSASQGTLSGSGAAVYYRTITIDGVSVNVACFT